MQIRFDAGKEAYEQSYKAIADNARVAADATAAYNKALEDREENQRLVREGDQRAIETSAEYEAGVRDAERAMNEANAVLSASRDSMSLLKDEQLLLSQAMSEGKGSVSEYVASNDFLLASLQGAGQSCLDFSGTLQGVGASVADLAKLNEEQLPYSTREPTRKSSPASSPKPGRRPRTSAGCRPTSLRCSWKPTAATRTPSRRSSTSSWPSTATPA